MRTIRRRDAFTAVVSAALALVVVLVVGLSPAANPHARAEGFGPLADVTACHGPDVLLVHDLAGTAADWDLLAHDLRAAGWCSGTIEWGRPRPGDAPIPLGGLTGVEAAAETLVRDKGWDSGERPPVPVVARGVGGLVVQRAVQLSAAPAPPVSALVTLGPVWHGTNVAGLADVEDLSRALGTFDAILAWERTWMDPVCEGCREAVRGSDLLRRLHREGVRTPGIAYTDIVSPVDLLVHPPLAQSPPDTEVLEVGPFSGGRIAWHGELGRDPDSRALVVDALGPT